MLPEEFTYFLYSALVTFATLLYIAGLIVDRKMILR